MTTKNWAAQAVSVNRFSGNKANRKRILTGKANPLVRAAAIEALESRQMLSAAPVLTIGGSTSVNEGSSYALSLNASAGANLTNWTIDWGDGTIATPDTQTVAGAATSATHVYTDGPSSHTITATGTNADGTFTAQNAAGVAVNNGTLDATFGTGGKVIDSNGTGIATVIQPDGKILVGGSTGDFADFKLTRFNANGTIDTTFGTGGSVTTDFGGGFDDITALTLQTDGKIVAVGHSLVSGSAQPIVVARYNTNGSLDTTFGDTVGSSQTGKIITYFPFPALDQKAQSVAIAPGGGIIVGGSAHLFITGAPIDDFAVIKYTSSGTLDLTFGAGGEVLSDVGGLGFNIGKSVIAQANGTILLAGQASVLPDGNSAVVVRYSSIGVQDLTFGNAGFASAGKGNATSMARLADGSILLGGFNGNGSSLIVAKFDSNGHLTTFGTGGVASSALAGDSSVSIGVQSDGKIVLATAVNNGATNDDVATVRFTSAGVVDTGYGTNGVVLTDLNGGLDVVGSYTQPFAGQAVAIDSSDRIVVVGTATAPTPGDTIAIVRYGGAPAPLTVQVANVAPTASITGDSIGVRGQPRTENITVVDPSSVDMASASSLVTINWGDATAPTTMTFSQFSAGAVAKQHVYAADGTYTITVTATDKDGGATTKTKNISITPFAIEGSVLAIGGVTADDTIFINPGGGYGIKVKDNGTQTSFNLSQITEIDIFQIDADGIFVAGGVKVPVYFYYYDSNGVLVDSEVLH